MLVEAAVTAEDELIKPLFDFRNNGIPIGNGWSSPANGARWGYDYLSRAATARSNMYDNAPEETRYIYTDFDADKKRPTGCPRPKMYFPYTSEPIGPSRRFLMAPGCRRGPNEQDSRTRRRQTV